MSVCRRLRPDCHDVRGVKAAATGRARVDRALHRLPRSARLGGAVEARRAVCRSGRTAPTTDQADPVPAQRRGWWQRTPRDRRELPALRPVRGLPRAPRASVAVVEMDGRARRGELRAGDDPAPVVHRQLRHDRHHREHRRRSGGAGSAGLGTPKSPGTDRRRHDQGLPDRDGGFTARGRDSRRLAAALPAAA